MEAETGGMCCQLPQEAGKEERSLPVRFQKAHGWTSVLQGIEMIHFCSLKLHGDGTM